MEENAKFDRQATDVDREEVQNILDPKDTVCPPIKKFKIRSTRFPSMQPSPNVFVYVQQVISDHKTNPVGRPLAPII